MSATNFRIEEIKFATLNGSNVKTFKAFKKDAVGFVFVGQFSAPRRTANKNLWKVAAQA